MPKVNLPEITTRNPSLSKALNLIKELQSYGLKLSGLQDTLAASDPKPVLKKLGELVDYDLKSLEDNIKAIATEKANLLVNEIITQRLQESFWVSKGIVPANPVTIGAGGFNWIAQVRCHNRDLALTIPKFKTDDYLNRVSTRRLFSDTVPVNIGFYIPRVIEVFSVPFPAVLMTIAEGDNCYKKCFDLFERSLGTDESAAVFKQLGFMASGFSGISNSTYGPITGPRFKTAVDYLRASIEIVRKYVSKSETLDLQNQYGYKSTDLSSIIDWVVNDLQCSSLKPQLVHPDLSPWNLHHNATNGKWTITDGDDAFYGINGQQIGVCLISMRGNSDPKWIKALAQGIRAETNENESTVLLRGCAYGIVSYGLYAAAIAENIEQQAWNLKAIAPLVRLYQDTI